MTVQVYVRKGASDEERRISFARPKGIPASTLLDNGIAIDGNQALISLERTRDPQAPYHHPLSKQGFTSLSEALVDAEKALCAFLSEHDEEVEFA